MAQNVLRMPVTQRALVQRINRALRREDEGEIYEVRKVRGARALQEFGDYYLLDCRINVVSESHVDLDELGRELGVLRAWEKLEGVSEE